MIARRVVLPLLLSAPLLSCNGAEPFDPRFGSIEVNVSVAGKHITQSGVALEVWAEHAHEVQPVAWSGRIPLRRVGDTSVFRLAGVEAGDYRVMVGAHPLDDSWPSYCQMDQPAPDGIIRVRGNQTSSLWSAVTCVRMGYIRVGNITGPVADPDGYVVYVQHPWYDNEEGDGFTVRVPANGQGMLGPLILKAHEVVITDVAPNCEVGRRTSAQIRVEDGATAEFEFEIRCR